MKIVTYVWRPSWKNRPAGCFGKCVRRPFWRKKKEKKAPPPSFFPQRQDANHVFFSFFFTAPYDGEGRGGGGGGALESVSLQRVVNRVIEWLKMVYRDNWGYHYDLVDNLSLSEQIWFLSWFKRYMCFMKCPILPKMSDSSNIILKSVSSLNILESSCFQESRLPYITGYLHPESCTCEIWLGRSDTKYESRIKE